MNIGQTIPTLILQIVTFCSNQFAQSPFKENIAPKIHKQSVGKAYFTP